MSTDRDAGPAAGAAAERVPRGELLREPAADALAPWLPRADLVDVRPLAGADPFRRFFASPLTCRTTDAPTRPEREAVQYHVARDTASRCARGFANGLDDQRE